MEVMDSLKAIQEISEQVVQHFVSEATKPAFFVSVMIGNSVLYTPFVMLFNSQWRTHLYRFITNDDQHNGKEDLRDANLNLVAYLLFVWGIHVTTHDMLYDANHYEYVALFFGTGLVLLGLKEGFKSRQSKNPEV
jgi:hypothetical protein